MAYPPTTYVDGTTPVNGVNLNKLETAVSKVPYGPDFSSGRIPVWNGSAWSNQFIFDGQIAPTAAIAISKLKDYPADGTKVLKGDGTWGAAGGHEIRDEGVALASRAALDFVGAGVTATDDAAGGRTLVTIPGGSAPSYGTTLPASPVDGQEAILVDSLTNPTYQWRFRYNAGSTSPYKWEFIGGASAFAEVEPMVAHSSTTYAALTGSAGPALAIPRAGEYDVQIGCRTFVTANDLISYMSYDIGATAALDIDCLQYLGAISFSVTMGGSTTPNVTRARRKTFTGALTLTAKYKASAAQAYFGQRWMRVTPMRVS